MKDTQSDTDFYSSPKSAVSDGAAESHLSKFQFRFWLACLICGITLPWLIFGLMEIDADAWLFVLFGFAIWLWPVFWVFLKEIKSTGFKKISTMRFILVSLGYSAAAIAIAFCSFGIASIAFYIYRNL